LERHDLLGVDHDDFAAWLFDLNELAACDGGLKRFAQLINRRLD